MKEPVDTEELMKILTQESKVAKSLQHFLETSQEIDATPEDTDDTEDTETHFDKLTTFFMNENGQNICDVLTEMNQHLSTLVSLVQNTTSQ